MLGFGVFEATVSRYMPRRPADPDQLRRWVAFLHNHKDAIAAMHFFTVPTISLRVLYAFFIIKNDSLPLILIRLYAPRAVFTSSVVHCSTGYILSVTHSRASRNISPGQPMVSAKRIDMGRVMAQFFSGLWRYNETPAIGLPGPWRFFVRPDLFFPRAVAMATPFGLERRQAGCELRQHPGSLMKYPG